MKTTNILQGIPASPGIAIGKVFLLEDEDYCLLHREIPKDAIKKEVNRFKEALTKTRSEMLSTQEKIHKTLGKEYARLADAYLLILEDPTLELWQDHIKQNMLQLFEMLPNQEQSYLGKFMSWVGTPLYNVFHPEECSDTTKDGF